MFFVEWRERIRAANLSMMPFSKFISSYNKAERQSQIIAFNYLLFILSVVSGCMSLTKSVPSQKTEKRDLMFTAYAVQLLTIYRHPENSSDFDFLVISIQPSWRMRSGIPLSKASIFCFCESTRVVSSFTFCCKP